MLSNNLSEQAEKVLQLPTGFTEKKGLRPLVGKGFYSRCGNLVGYVLNLETTQKFMSSGSTSNNIAADRAENYITYINRIVLACSHSASSFHTGGEVQGIWLESQVIINIQPQALLIKRFVATLIRATERCRDLGFRFCIAFEGKGLSFIHEHREFRQVLYLLSDHNVELIMRNPILSEPNLSSPTTVERATSIISVTPEWLGISACEQSFDHSQYLEQVTRLSSAIHEHGKKIVLEGIENEWQKSFVSSLPIAYFSLTRSDDDVYI